MPRGDDVFVRYYTRFLLEDFRYLRHGLAARAVFQHLSAVAVSRRSEFLPARYDADALAVGMRAPIDEVRAGLEELIVVDRDPLVGRLVDGRLRVVDVRKCHGEKFRWIDETEAFEAWAAEHGETAPAILNAPLTGTNGGERGQPGALGREVRGERGDTARRRRPSGGGDVEAVKKHDVTPHDPDNGALSNEDEDKEALTAMHEFERLTSGINGKGKKRDADKAKAMALARGLVNRDYDGRLRALTLALDVTGKDPPPHPWAWMCKALAGHYSGTPSGRTTAKGLLG